MNSVTVSRPLNATKLALAFGIKPFLAVHHLMEMNYFATLNAHLKDEEACALARRLGFDLKIEDGEEGSAG